jgi:hypothetical protein
VDRISACRRALCGGIPHGDNILAAHTERCTRNRDSLTKFSSHVVATNSKNEKALRQKTAAAIALLIATGFSVHFVKLIAKSESPYAAYFCHIQAIPGHAGFVGNVHIINLAKDIKYLRSVIERWKISDDKTEGLSRGFLVNGIAGCGQNRMCLWRDHSISVKAESFDITLSGAVPKWRWVDRITNGTANLSRWSFTAIEHFHRGIEAFDAELVDRIVANSQPGSLVQFELSDASIKNLVSLNSTEPRLLYGTLHRIGGPLQFMQLSCCIVRVKASDDNQHNRAYRLDSLRPIAFLLAALIAACGVVYSGVRAFDGGWKLLFIPLGIIFMLIAFICIHHSLDLIDPDVPQVSDYAELISSKNSNVGLRESTHKPVEVWLQRGRWLPIPEKLTALGPQNKSKQFSLMDERKRPRSIRDDYGQIDIAERSGYRMGIGVLARNC